jgi:hypothetical protein
LGKNKMKSSFTLLQATYLNFNVWVRPNNILQFRSVKNSTTWVRC